jgi:hypothetical protein
MKTTNINQSAIELWRSFSPPDDRPPLLYPQLNEDGILFIGCNPAWLEKMKAKSFKELLDNPSLQESMIKEEEKIRREYPYFKPCRDIAEAFGVNWAHVDWFFTRETSQQTAEERLLAEPAQWDAPVKLTPFAQSQVDLARKLIDSCAPRVIVVINALASKIARTTFELHTQPLDEGGFYQADIEGRKVPVILSGMLTGQRALDQGSRERLQWHIKQALTERMQQCPFCQAEVERSTRYPDYVCSRCLETATDEKGRRVIFGNADIEGGIKGIYTDTNEEYISRSCFIEGHPCTASEARFGGIVITPNEK